MKFAEILFDNKMNQVFEQVLPPKRQNSKILSHFSR